MIGEFVEKRQGSFFVSRSRVPLGHLVREYQEGESPEAIRTHYPVLSLEQVYGAITFYLGHRQEIDDDLRAREREEDEYSKANPAPPENEAEIQGVAELAAWKKVAECSDRSGDDQATYEDRGNSANHSQAISSSYHAYCQDNNCN